jgi:hypothetical protein
MLKRFVIVAFVVGLASYPTPALAEGTMTGSTSQASATLVISDAAFDGPDCISVPFVVGFTRTPTVSGDISARVDVTARQSNSKDDATDFVSTSFYESSLVTEEETLYVCPSSFEEDSIPASVTGLLTTEDASSGSEEVVAMQPVVSMNLIRNQSVMSKIRTRKVPFSSSDERQISGQVLVRTASKGLLGAGGTISLEVQKGKKKKKKWRLVTQTVPDKFGKWDVTLDGVPKGTKLRVTLAECGWCTTTTRTFKIKR